MFYSHQLLARKAPLGQIWMAATMHAKMNRRKLDQINIIRICEEILNPSVPMALRLSGILMGGVVIVYERKVRLLFDDVNRLLIEINSAWKVKPAVDPTVLPKGKTQAKFEAVTLPENHEADSGDVEQSIDYSSKQTSMGFQQTAYFAMRLDTIDELTESFMESLKEKEPNEQHHQADPANITLDEPYVPYQVETGPYNRYERFDIEGDEETHFNFPSQECTQIPTTPVCSPHPEMETRKDANHRIYSTVDDIPDQHPDKQANQSSPHLEDARQQPKKELQERGPPRKKARRQAPFMMDEQTMIPSNLYQSWLQDSSEIFVRRPKIGEQSNPKSTMKVAKLMELPPVAVSCGLIGKYREVHYPQPLLDLWMRSIQQPHDSPSGRSTSPRPPQPSSSSPPPPHGQGYQDPPEFPMGGFGNGVTTERLASKEKLRSNQTTGTELPINEFNLMFDGVGNTDPKAPPSSGTDIRSSSVPSAGIGLDFFSNTSDSNSGRFNKKRPYSSSRLNGIGLESLYEENQWIHEAAEHNFPVIGDQPESSSRIPRFSQHGPTPEHELLVQTAHTQTQHHPMIDEEAERMTNNITMHLKTYFETPGAAQTESLNQLAYGMNKKQAAQLFYQSCVLATRDVLKVQQNLAYGDIIISRGAKM